MSEDLSEAQEKGRSDGTNGSAAPIEEIRRLLVSPERLQIRKLQDRVEDPQLNTEMVSRVLPEAMALRAQRDNQLAASFLPTVETAIALSVKKRPEVLAGAIFPLLGPAIRKAIAATLGAMLVSLNQTLEQSLSPRSLGWRLEAWRTGKSFSEIVLLRTLEYRVEQIFLIHSRTGLLLQHVSATTMATGADMISAMLTAINDFVHDSFHLEKTADIDALQVGEWQVWIARGPQAVLAAVIRGEAPSDLRVQLQETIEQIHRQHPSDLADFDGNSAPFESCRALLDACLTFRLQERKSQSYRALGVVAALAVLVGSALLVRPILQEFRWRNYVRTLREQPGIVLIEADTLHGKYHLTGLRDPLAQDPSALLRAARLVPQDVEARWEPYASSYAEFVLARARELLAPPPGVSLQVRDGVLHASGTAPQIWIRSSRKQAHFVGGISSYDDSQLAVEEIVPLREAARRLESTSLDFLSGTTALAPGESDKLPKIVQEMQVVVSRAASANKKAQIIIVGHADKPGDERFNEQLSQMRADAILRRLESSGLPRGYFIARGVGTRVEPGDTVSRSELGPRRAVSFRVELQEN
jgi:outer membrane protein OmpA-like peptidoglycan-associated protein